MILLAVAREESDIETLTAFIKFLETCPAHVAGGACKEYGFLCHIL